MKIPKTPQRIEFMGREMIQLQVAKVIPSSLYLSTYYGSENPENVGKIIKRELEYELLKQVKDHIVFAELTTPGLTDTKVFATIELIIKNPKYSWTRSQ